MERKIPRTEDYENREVLYILDNDGNSFEKKIFKKVTNEIIPLIPKNGGVISENCKIVLPTNETFYGLSYKGDITGWRKQIELGAEALGLLTAEINGNEILLSDNRSYILNDCIIEFY